MKALILFAALVITIPALAETPAPAPKPPSAPVQDARKATPDKPLQIYDSVRRPLPSRPSSKPGPGIG
jgi:hypothetical protein